MICRGMEGKGCIVMCPGLSRVRRYKQSLVAALTIGESD